MKVAVNYAPEAWRMLNGLFCVYKPSEMSFGKLRAAIIYNLCKDLNSLKQRPIQKMVQIEGSVSSGQSFKVETVDNLADHPLVVGPRYQHQDLRVAVVHKPSFFYSGLCILGVNDGCFKCNKLREGRLLKSFRLHGKFGIATDSQNITGNIVEKATYGHISSYKINQVLASVQAAHQRLMFSTSGIDPLSQEAYELASKGMIRPSKKSSPILYGLKLLSFKQPDFLIEVQCINETEQYLMELIAEIGLYLKSVATCVQIQCTRHGNFTLDQTLLRGQWNLEGVIDNIALCDKYSKLDQIVPSTPLLSRRISNDRC